TLATWNGEKYLKLFERIFEKYQPELEIREACSSRELAVTAQLREEIYLREIAYVGEHDLIDEFDESSTVCNMYYQDKPIGTIRFVDSREQTPEMLQTHPELEQYFPPDRHYLEAGRYMVLKNYR